MLHQTLISSSPSSPFSSSFPKPFHFLSYPPLPQLEKQQEVSETKMEPFKSVFYQQNGVSSEDAVFVGERGNNTLFGGDAFSVEELLDLGEFTETQDIPQERKEIEKRVEKAGEIKEERENSNSSNSSSGVTFDLPPPPSVIDLPAHDAEELEWVSLIMDESLSELPAATCTALPPPVPSKQSDNRTNPKPTLCVLSTESFQPVAKSRRSKRSRATFWSLSGSDNSSSSSSTTSSCSSSFLFYDSPFYETPSFLLESPEEPPVKKPKKRGRKPKVPRHNNQYSYPQGAAGERRCSHCGVNKTPQWRAGPEGAKTLCNACGVRYKSGRLLPEYRPACSPTFVSDLHSNSHRKVLEMRKKKEDVVPVVASF